MDIKWKEGAVCFADGSQWFLQEIDTFINNKGGFMCASDLVDYSDFQLNTINQGDCIEASELNGKKDFSNTIKVFELFGFAPYLNCDMDISEFILTTIDSGLGFIADSDGDLVIDYNSELDKSEKKRKLTYSQLMAIGKLKRLMDERDKVNDSEKPNSSEFRDGNKYHRTIIGLDGTKATVDVYRVLDAFNTCCSATDHAIKKMLCAGLRGHKDKLTDYDNAIESLQAAKELLVQKDSNANNTN